MKGKSAGRVPSDTHVLAQMGTVSTSYFRWVLFSFSFQTIVMFAFSNISLL